MFHSIFFVSSRGTATADTYKIARPIDSVRSTMMLPPLSESRKALRPHPTRRIASRCGNFPATWVDDVGLQALPDADAVTLMIAQERGAGRPRE